MSDTAHLGDGASPPRSAAAPPDGWRFWPRFAVRGAGFPMRRVLALASPALAAAADLWLALPAASRAAGRPALERAYADAAAGSSRELREVARDPRFREAVLWQNAHAVRTGIDPLLASAPGASDSKTRQRERLVASYLQRYATKNDSIGFFGPIGWGVYDDHAPELEVCPGPRLVGARAVYFEHWCVAAVADALAALPGIRPWLRPRRSPLVRLEAGALVHLDRVEPVDELTARVLALAGGELTARALAARAGAPEPAVLARLAELADQGAVRWRLDVPTVGQPFERHLWATVDAIEDPAVRGPARAMLEELEQARARVAGAAGDPPGLEAALGQLAATFERHTGARATRNAGALYGGRTLVYEDCRRDCHVAIGRGLRAHLARSLALLLASSRWVSAALARCYEAELVALFRALRPAGAAALPFPVFWAAAAAMFPRVGGAAPPAVSEVLADYQARWRRVLPWAPGARRIERTLEEIAPRVRAEFAAPGPGFPSARHHSPDVMIAAPDAEAVRRGDYLLVVGEVHSCINTLEQELFVQEHPAREELLAALAEDLPSGRLAPVVPAALASRCQATPYSRHPLDVAIEFDDAASWRPAAQTLAIADLVIEEHGASLRVRTRDGARAWDLAGAFDCVLGQVDLPPFAPEPHAPRVTVDRLVIARETWRFEAAELPFARLASACDRFVETRRWAQHHGLPRFAFFKTSAEGKPAFLDLDAPVLVEQFLKLARNGERVTVVEMLPTPDQCWLADERGDRYTAELRTVAVDPRAYAAPAPPAEGAG